MDPKMKNILRELNLTDLQQTFEREEIDFDGFMAMTAQDFTDLNISIGKRAKLMKYQRDITGESSAPTPAPAPAPSPSPTYSHGARSGYSEPPTQQSTHAPPPRSYNQDYNSSQGYNRGHDSYTGSSQQYSSQGSYETNSWNRTDQYGGFNQHSQDERPLKSEFDPDLNPDQLFESHVNIGIDFNKYEELKVDVYGEDVPGPIDRFEDMGLPQWLAQNIKKIGWLKPTPIQRRAFPCVDIKRHVMGCAQTGSGKTAAFLLPVMKHLGENPGRQTPSCILLAPTRELAQQLYEEAYKLSYRSGIRLAVVFGGGDKIRQAQKVRAGCDLVIGTPGRFIDYLDNRTILLKSVQYVILDEADRMLDMGFDHDINLILTKYDLPLVNTIQMLMFSATLGASVVKLARKYLQCEIFIAVGRIGGTSDSIEQQVWKVEARQKTEALRRVLCEHNREQVLVFCNTKKGCDQLASIFNREAVSIHGDKSQGERERSLKAFKLGKTRILIATDVASRGLDLPNVSLVINYDLPNNTDDYIHRIGRTGRAGNRGKAISFYNDRENWNLRNALCSVLIETNQKIPDFFDSATAIDRTERELQVGIRPQKYNASSGYRNDTGTRDFDGSGSGSTYNSRSTERIENSWNSRGRGVNRGPSRYVRGENRAESRGNSYTTANSSEGGWGSNDTKSASTEGWGTNDSSNTGSGWGNDSTNTGGGWGANESSNTGSGWGANTESEGGTDNTADKGSNEPGSGWGNNTTTDNTSGWGENSSTQNSKGPEGQSQGWGANDSAGWTNSASSGW